jgi:hypothetical protein
MAPAALQGYWIFEARDRNRVLEASFEIEQYLIDTCWAWRKQGPLAKAVMNQLNQG